MSPRASRSLLGAAGLLAAAALALAGCGSGGHAAVAAGPPAPTTPPATPSSTSPSTSPTVPVAAPTRTSQPATPTAAPVHTPASRPAPAPAAAPVASDLLVEHLVGVGNARQVVSVTASGYGTSYATLQAFTRTAAGWTRTFGPWTARIGRNGFAPPGQKREGDGRTPTGAYGFSYFFGVNPNPGVHYAYRQITSRQVVWDDDPSSPNYNLWQDTPAQAGVSPEPMYNTPSYDYGAVIAYNTARTPGLGSAIFFHQFSASGGSTAGCVSLPQGELLSVLRWLDPAAGPVIVMGTSAAVTR